MLEDDMRYRALLTVRQLFVASLLLTLFSVGQAQFSFPSPPDHPTETTPAKPSSETDRWVPEASYAIMLGSEPGSDAPRFEAVAILDDVFDLPLTLRAEVATHGFTRNEGRLNLLLSRSRFYAGGGVRYGQAPGRANTHPTLRGGAIVGTPVPLNDDLTVLAEVRADTPFDAFTPSITAAFGIQYHP